MKRLRHLGIYIGLALLFCLLCIHRYMQKQIIGYGDDGSYHHLASLPLFSRELWVTFRPVGIPLFYKMCGNDRSVIAFVQQAFSIAAWLAFAGAFSTTIAKRWLKLVSFGVILAFGYLEDNQGWNKIIWAESQNISFVVLILAASYAAIHRFWRKPDVAVATQVKWAAGLFFLFMLWSAFRDANAYHILGFAGCLASLTAIYSRSLRKIRIFVLILCLGTAAVFYEQTRTANSTVRWNPSFINVICRRILPFPERVEFFVKHGMPYDDQVRSFTGQQYINVPEEAPLRKWVYTLGRPTYFKFLLSHAPQTFVEPFANWEETFRHTCGYALKGRTDLQRVLEFILFPLGWRLVLLALVALGICMHAVVRGVRDPRFIVPVICLIMVYPMAFFSWHVDAVEVARHSIVLGLLSRISGWILILLALDRYFSTRRAQAS